MQVRLVHIIVFELKVIVLPNNMDRPIGQWKELEVMGSDFPTKHSAIGRVYISYQQAKIGTLLGHKKEAVELLKRSRTEG